jgi:hypothetical protein
MSTATIETATPTRSAALHYYRLAVLVLVVTLAATIGVIIYMAAQPTPTAEGTTRSVPAGTSQSDPCFRQAVPC